jgi:phosphoribosylformylglycinamidine synthase
MKKVKTLILRTAGTNCDVETAHAFKLAGSEPDLVHINSVVKDSSLLKKYDILAIPGGFTYGDDIASGKILANELKNFILPELTKFVESGKPIIGICNGFQVLVKMGLLPDTKRKRAGKVESTLSLNNSGKFEARWVYLKKDPAAIKCVWTRGLPDTIFLPVAHGEGKFIPADDDILMSLRENGQIVLRYSDPDGRKPAYPSNPNGSVDDIAGISDPSGHIFGLMPHPERHVAFTQHPHWQRTIDRSSLGAGLQIFKNGVNFVRMNG